MIFLDRPFVERVQRIAAGGFEVEIALLERAMPFIGEIQVADVPGRREPGTGEINYPAVAAALRRLGYTGAIGMEAWASGDSEVALARFRAAFEE
jgi:hydroxypyruvate isomerase